MVKVITLLSFLFSFNLYAGFGCDIAETGAQVASELIVKNFRCENETQVLEDIEKLIRLERICNEKFVEKINSPVICAVVAKSTAAYVAQKIPEQWECDERTSRDFVDRAIYKACISILPDEE